MFFKETSLVHQASERQNILVNPTKNTYIALGYQTHLCLDIVSQYFFGC